MTVLQPNNKENQKPAKPKNASILTWFKPVAGATKSKKEAAETPVISVSPARENPWPAELCEMSTELKSLVAQLKEDLVHRHPADCVDRLWTFNQRLALYIQSWKAALSVPRQDPPANLLISWQTLHSFHLFIDSQYSQASLHPDIQSAVRELHHDMGALIQQHAALIPPSRVLSPYAQGPAPVDINKETFLVRKSSADLFSSRPLNISIVVPTEASPVTAPSAQSKKRTRKHMDDSDISHLFELPVLSTVESVYWTSYPRLSTDTEMDNDEPGAGTRIPLSMQTLIQTCGIFTFVRDFGSVFGIQGSDELELHHFLNFFVNFGEWEWFGSVMQSLLFPLMPEEAPEVQFISMQAMFAYFLNSESDENPNARRLAELFEKMEFIDIPIQDRVLAFSIVVDALCETDIFRDHINEASKRVKTLNNNQKPIKRKELNAIIQEMSLLNNQLDAARFKLKQQTTAHDAFMQNIEREIEMILDEEEGQRDDPFAVLNDKNGLMKLSKDQIRDLQERREKSSRQRDLVRGRRRKKLLSRHQETIDEQESLLNVAEDQVDELEGKIEKLKHIRETIEEDLNFRINDEVGKLQSTFRDSDMIVLGTDRDLKKYIFCPYLGVILVESQDSNQHAVIESKESLIKNLSALNPAGFREKVLRNNIETHRDTIIASFSDKHSLWPKLMEHFDPEIAESDEEDEDAECESVTKNLAFEFQQHLLDQCRDMVFKSIGSLFHQFKQYADKIHLHSRLSEKIRSFDVDTFTSPTDFYDISTDEFRLIIRELFEYLKPSLFFPSPLDGDSFYASEFVLGGDVSKESNVTKQDENLVKENDDMMVDDPPESAEDPPAVQEHVRKRYDRWIQYLDRLHTFSALGFFAENLHHLLVNVQKSLRKNHGPLVKQQPAIKKAKTVSKGRKSTVTRLRSSRIAAMDRRPKYEESDTENSDAEEEKEEKEGKTAETDQDSVNRSSADGDTGRRTRSSRRISKKSDSEVEVNTENESSSSSDSHECDDDFHAVQHFSPRATRRQRQQLQSGSKSRPRRQLTRLADKSDSEESDSE